jgi:hypothetical protein
MSRSALAAASDGGVVVATTIRHRHAVIVAAVAPEIVVVIMIAIVITYCLRCIDGSHNNGILASPQDGGRKARAREGFNLGLVAQEESASAANLQLI